METVVIRDRNNLKNVKARVSATLPLASSKRVFTEFCSFAFCSKMNVQMVAFDNEDVMYHQPHT